MTAGAGWVCDTPETRSSVQFTNPTITSSPGAEDLTLIQKGSMQMECSVTTLGLQGNNERGASGWYRVIHGWYNRA